MPETSITQATTVQQMDEIIALQRSNLKAHLSSSEMAEQGFLTVPHTSELLERMNQPMPHSIAVSEGHVAAYALTMTRAFASAIPALVPMFEEIDSTVWQGKTLGEVNYVVMGQICVGKPFRGLGLVSQLYDYMAEQAIAHGFDYIITEIAEANSRSLAAHARSGFQTLHVYEADGTRWVLVIRPLI
jgi:ribosomal protein S18 acetylase RimI-like enzyme